MTRKSTAFFALLLILCFSAVSCYEHDSIIKSVVIDTPDNSTLWTEDGLRSQLTLKCDVETYQDFSKCEIKWESSNNKVAEVSSAGVVTAKSVGDVEIRAVVLASDESYFERKVADPLKISVRARLDMTRVGVEGTIDVTEFISGDVMADAEGKDVDWESEFNGKSKNNQEVTTEIDKNGILKINGEIDYGEIDISGKADDFDVAFQIMVGNNLLKSMSFAQQSFDMVAGESADPAIVFDPLDAQDVDLELKSLDDSIVSIGTDNKIRAVSAGQTTVEALTSDGAFQASCLVSVSSDAQVSSVTIFANGDEVDEDDAIVLYLDEEADLDAVVSVLPDSSDLKGVDWKSSASSFVSVDQDGTIKGLAIGEATITAESTQDETKKATCKVVVKTDPTKTSGTFYFTSDSFFGIRFGEGDEGSKTWRDSDGNITDDNWIKVSGDYDTPMNDWITWDGKWAPAVKNEKDGKYYIYLRGKNNATISPLDEDMTAQYFPGFSFTVSADSPRNISEKIFNAVVSSEMREHGLPVPEQYLLSGLDNIDLSFCDNEVSQEDERLRVECHGDIRALRNWDDYDAIDMGDGCYSCLFLGSYALSNVPELPDTKLSKYCYTAMFYNCFNITKGVSVLPATRLANNCYEYMFEYCWRLESAMDDLPADVLDEFCYSGMFYDCFSLKKAPTISATKLDNYSCTAMFSGCISLTDAPALPVNGMTYKRYELFDEDLDEYIYVREEYLTQDEIESSSDVEDCEATHCYMMMFRRCTSLTSIPALLSTVLAEGCYYQMFFGCNNIVFSETQSAECPNEFKIPELEEEGNDAISGIFGNTSGCLSEGDPEPGTLYYTNVSLVAPETE